MYFKAKAWITLILALGAVILYMGTQSTLYKEFLSSGSSKVSVREISAESGVVHRHSSYQVSDNLKHLEPFLTSIGASVSVADYDNDGAADIFLNGSAAGNSGQLFRNTGDGRFEDVTEKLGIARLSEYPVTRSAFFDCDGDGYRDLFLHASCPRVFKNLNGKGFRDITQETGLPCDFADLYSALQAQDLFGDGSLDLIFAGLNRYTERYYEGNVMGFTSTKVMTDNFAKAEVGLGRTRVFKNDGTCRFKEIQTGLEHEALTHAIGIQVIDGRKVIWFASDFDFDRAYIQEVPGKFRDISHRITGPISHTGMGVDFADLDHDEEPYIFITQVFEPREMPAGNTLWKWSQEGVLSSKSNEWGVQRCGWAWGARFADIDNSGEEDLLVSNGQISGDPNAGSYYYSLSVLNSASRDYVSEGRNWPPIGKKSQSGFQQDCVFLNRGEGKFEAADLPEFDRDRFDGRGLAMIDYLGNGHLAAIVANQKQPSRFYAFKPAPENQWIGFSLRATRTHWEAWGTVVEVELADRTLRKELQPLNGYAAQSDARVHFGLGPAPALRAIRIHWPSGDVQTVENFKINSYNAVVEKESK